MKSFSKVLRSAGMNWLSLAMGMIVTFLLSPVVVHRLGNSLYGVWSLIVATMSYLALLDLGLRGAVTRYVAREVERRDFAAAGRTISSALVLRLGAAAVIVAVSVILAYVLPGLLHIPLELRRITSIALAIAGGTLANQMVGGIFGAVLAAEHRFDIISFVSIVQTLVRAISVYLVLISGRSIVAVAVCEFAAVSISTISLAFFSKRQLPEVSFKLAKPEGSMIREIWRFSSSVFLINVCQQIIFYTDNLVIGFVISATAVTFYTIGGSLIEYLRQIVSSLTTTIMPLAAKFDASGDKDQLRELLVRGAQISLLIALPICVTLFGRGQEFIAIWMGAQYAPISGRVLQILSVSSVFVAANAAGTNVLYGTSSHGTWAKFVTLEALLNLVGSIVLCSKFGVIGVAVGTAIPSLFVNLWLMPRYLAHVTKCPLKTYLLEGWGKPLLASVPLIAATLLAARFFPSTGYLELAGSIAVCMLAYVGAVVLVFLGDVRKFRQASQMAKAVNV